MRATVFILGTALLASQIAYGSSLRERALERLERNRSETLNRLEGRDTKPGAARSTSSTGKVFAPPRQPQTDFDVETGTFRTLIPAGPYGATDPVTGDFYRDIGHGYVNTKTGEFVPKH